ncbi:MAG TPA: lactate utilization protein [Pyrinomonadaceae bacterium]|nr:lactate utilization protein [Pyrinomonadaceae bacterium]
MASTTDREEEMLARVARALGREGAAPPEPLCPFNVEAERPDVEALGARFRAELERVGGRVARVASAGEVHEYLRALLPGDEAPTVALSDGPEVRRARVGEFVRGLGARVVPTLKEFVAEAGRGETAAPGEGTLTERYQRLLLGAQVGVTSADYALADTGTLVLLSGGEQHRLVSLLPPVHVCLLRPERILPNMSELLALLGEAYASGAPPQALTCVTGPSRTADIEQAITLGVHGPRSLHVLLTGAEEAAA